MQSKVLIVTLVIVSSMFGYTSALCEPKLPMKHYKPNLVEAKFYLVAMKIAFPYQRREAHCGISDISEASRIIFTNEIKYQDYNGNPGSFILTIENTFPPGSYDISGDDGTKFQGVVLGALQHRVYVLYGCNSEENREAVWVYYSARVQGLGRMDAKSQQYVRDTLAKNNIRLNDLQYTDNNNCNN